MAEQFLDGSVARVDKEYQEYLEGGWIQTYTGQKFYPLNPKPENIFIEDIAHSLSLQCRFTGHVKNFYSVGFHSILVSEYCSEENRLWGLLHDASEAYLSDLARPIKRYSHLGAVYKEVEDRLMEVICEKFELPKDMPAEVHEVDTRMLMTEKRDLLLTSIEWDGAWNNSPCQPKAEPYIEKIVQCEKPHITEFIFLKRFYQFYGHRY